MKQRDSKTLKLFLAGILVFASVLTDAAGMSQMQDLVILYLGRLLIPRANRASQ